MEGVSRPEFVYAVNQLKLVRRWMTPFLRVSDTCFKEKKIKEFLAPYLASSLEVTAQIMGIHFLIFIAYHLLLPRSSRPKTTLPRLRYQAMRL